VNSRIAGALLAFARAAVAASREAGLRRCLDGMAALDARTTVQIGSVAIIVAVLCHAAIFAVLGVTVHALGWTTRAALLAAGLVMLRTPDAFAAAWNDRETRRPS
jgi:hypothetical protein